MTTAIRPQKTVRLATIALGYDLDLDREQRDLVAEEAYRVANRGASDFLRIKEFGIDTVVQRGSLDVFVTIIVSVPALLAALTLYGSAADGLDRLRTDLSAMRKYFVKELPEQAHLPRDAFESSRLTTEELSRVAKFIKSVQRGELAPDEAAGLALADLAGSDTHLDHDTIQQVRKSFREIGPSRERGPVSDSQSMGAGRESNAVARPRRVTRVPRRRANADGIRIWRDPNESRPHREEF